MRIFKTNQKLQYLVKKLNVIKCIQPTRKR